MKVLRIDHVAIAVRDLKAAEEHYINKLGAEKILTVVRSDTLYTVSYMKWGDSCLTLVQPDDPKCFIQRDIDRKGEGLHHMGIEVENLAEAEAYFIAHGGKVGPKETIDGVRSEFVVSPKNNFGTLLQVMEFYEPYKDKLAPVRYGILAKDGKLQK